jgi:hypothetical protein
MWWKNDRLEGLMAASLYEPLDERDQRALDAFLASSPEARADQALFRNMVDVIPTDQPVLDVDLLVAVRARLEEDAPARRPVLKLALAGAACALAVTATGYLVMNDFDGAEVGPRVAQHETETPVLAALRESEALLARNDAAAAHTVLAAAVQAHPGDPHAGRAHQELADLSFEHFHNYPEAYAAYAALKRDHPETFLSGSHNADRLDLLDESRRVEYASLHMLDAARMRRGAGSEAFEEVIAQHPTPGIVALAAAEMVRGEMESASGSDGILQAMGRVRERCTNPTALARLDYEIGLHYWTNLNDADAARDFGVRALESGQPAVVEVARLLLDDIDSAGRRN